MGNCFCCDEEDNILAVYNPMVFEKRRKYNGRTHTMYNPPRLQEMGLFPNG